MSAMHEFADEVRRSSAVVAAARWYAMAMDLRCEETGTTDVFGDSVTGRCGFVARRGSRSVWVWNELIIRASSFSLRPSDGRVLVSVDGGSEEPMDLLDAMSAIRGICDGEVES